MRSIAKLPRRTGCMMGPSKSLCRAYRLLRCGSNVPHPLATGRSAMPDDVKILSQMTNTPVTVTGLDHVVLRVADMDRSIAFYGDVLGCPVERRLESIGLVQLRAGTSM